MSLASRAVAFLNEQYRTVLRRMRYAAWLEQIEPMLTLVAEAPRTVAAAGRDVRERVETLLSPASSQARRRAARRSSTTNPFRFETFEPRVLMSVVPTLYWDPNGTAGLGGSGDWNDANWSTSAGGSATLVNWTPGANAVFSGAVGTVAMDANVSALSVTLNTADTITGGTLTLSAPTLSVASGVDATVGSVISGSVGLTKTGSGTLVLAGANNYTGTTTLSAGTIEIADDSAFGASTLALNNGTNLQTAGAAQTIGNAFQFTSGSNNAVVTIGGSANLTFTGKFTDTSVGTGTLTVNNAGLTTFSGGIDLRDTASGSAQRTFTFKGSGTVLVDSVVADNTASPGILVYNGTGTLILAASNTYSGTTTITAGTVQLGDGVTTDGSVAGKITDNGTLVFANFDAQTYGGVISGSGELMEAGSGTLTLTGANTYSGITTISDGAIEVGAGGSTGTLGTGAITDNGSLIFNRADTLTVSKVITGSGTLTQVGEGTLTVSAANTYNGTTTVADGTLWVTGTVASGLVDVSNGAYLAGTGILSGSVDVDGTLAAGTTGTGTLHVGNVTLESDSTFHVTANSGTAGSGYGQVIVNGPALVLDGATLDLSGKESHAGDQLVILNNTGGAAIDGTFSGLGEGDVTLANGMGYAITYQGGNGGQSVLLTVSTVAGPQPPSGATTNKQVSTQTLAPTGTPGYYEVTFSQMNESSWAPASTSHLTFNSGWILATSAQQAVALAVSGSVAVSTSSCCGGTTTYTYNASQVYMGTNAPGDYSKTGFLITDQFYVNGAEQNGTYLALVNLPSGTSSCGCCGCSSLGSDYWQASVVPLAINSLTVSEDAHRASQVTAANNTPVDLYIPEGPGGIEKVDLSAVLNTTDDAAPSHVLWTVDPINGSSGHASPASGNFGSYSVVTLSSGVGDFTIQAGIDEGNDAFYAASRTVNVHVIDLSSLTVTDASDGTNSATASSSAETPDLYVMRDNTGDAVVVLDAAVLPNESGAHIVWRIIGNNASPNSGNFAEDDDPRVTLQATDANFDFTAEAGIDTNGNTDWDTGDQMIDTVNIHVVRVNLGIDADNDSPTGAVTRDAFGKVSLNSTDQTMKLNGTGKEVMAIPDSRPVPQGSDAMTPMVLSLLGSSSVPAGASFKFETSAAAGPDGNVIEIWKENPDQTYTQIAFDTPESLTALGVNANNPANSAEATLYVRGLAVGVTTITVQVDWGGKGHWQVADSADFTVEPATITVADELYQDVSVSAVVAQDPQVQQLFIPKALDNGAPDVEDLDINMVAPANYAAPWEWPSNWYLH